MPEIGAELAQKWRISDAIAQSVLYHHNPDLAQEADRGMARTATLARMAAKAITAVEQDQPMVDLMMRANEWFDMDDNDVEKLLNNITFSAKELATLFSTRTSGNYPTCNRSLPELMNCWLNNKFSLSVRRSNFKSTPAIAADANRDGRAHRALLTGKNLIRKSCLHLNVRKHIRNRWQCFLSTRTTLKRLMTPTAIRVG